VHLTDDMGAWLAHYSELAIELTRADEVTADWLRQRTEAGVLARDLLSQYIRLQLPADATAQQRTLLTICRRAIDSLTLLALAEDPDAIDTDLLMGPAEMASLAQSLS
jgi:hypothetical protein